MDLDLICILFNVRDWLHDTETGYGWRANQTGHFCVIDHKELSVSHDGRECFEKSMMRPDENLLEK
jgi:hypothetical protein